jgi:threonine aldolase
LSGDFGLGAAAGVPIEVDLRSDTVTRPTEEMRRAMAAAEVGDDVYGEDPTVKALEEECAELLGHAAALFVPSGTMGNQIAIHLHTRPGEEVLIEASGHSYDWELGGMAMISGVQPRALAGDRGVLAAAAVARALAPRPSIRSRIGLAILENTHNMCGGRVWPLAELRAVQQACRAAGVAVHLDGARLFNAAVAAGAPVGELAAGFDSVMVSLSKGLCAPVGSVLAGSVDLIAAARRTRKLLGGGMRQVGVLAAAGRVAIHGLIDRLAEDHANARRLADGLTQIAGVELAFGHVDTNIVVVDVAGTGRAAVEIRDELRARGIACLDTGPSMLRLVTHRDVDAAGIERALAAAREVSG